MDLATQLSNTRTGVFVCPDCGCPIQRTTKDPNASTVLDGMTRHVDVVHPGVSLSTVLAS